MAMRTPFGGENRKFGPKKAKPASLLSLVLSVMVFLVVAWVIFLLYAWRSGVLHTDGLEGPEAFGKTLEYYVRAECLGTLTKTPTEPR